MAIKISYANQKGGVAKSTLTTMMANYLHFIHNKKVLVLDCDNQKSIEFKRISELDEASLALKVSRETIEQQLYKVISVDPLMVESILKKYDKEFDYIFIDVPGNITQDGVENCYLPLDYMIIPFTDSFLDISSTLHFYEEFKNAIQKEREVKIKVFGLLSKVNVNSINYKESLEYVNSDEFGIQMLKTPFKQSEKLKNTLTTDIYSNKSKDGDNIMELCNEIYSIIQNTK